MTARGLLLCLAALAVAAVGQYAPSRWGSFQRFPHGYVDRSDLDVHLVFPVYSRNTGGRAQLDGRLVYDSDLWYGAGGAWTPAAGDGWRFITHVSATVNETESTVCRSYNGRELQGFANETTYTFVAPDGTTAAVGSYRTVWGTGCGSASIGGKTTVVQTSGDTYTAYTSSSSAPSAYDSAGDSVLNGFADPSGNAVTSSTTSGVTTYTDPLGTVLTVTPSGSTVTYAYAGPGNTTASVVETTKSISAAASFGCDTAYSGSLTVPASITYPGVGTYSFSYDAAGRVASLTLPTGGVIYFSQTESCSSGLISGTLDRSESIDGSTKNWSWSSNGTQTTEVTPHGDESIYSFSGRDLSGVDHYQGTSSEVSATTIATSQPNGYVAGQTATTELFGSTPLYAVHSTSFDLYGNLTASSATDWGTSASGGPLLRSMAATWAVGAHGADQKQSQTVYGASNDVEAQTSWAYNGADEVTSRTQQTGSASLATTYSYNANGTLASVTAPNGYATTYSGYVCGSGLLPGTIQSPVTAVKTTLTWDCTGGVLDSSQDGNGALTKYGYGGPGNTWLTASVTDAAGNVAHYTYNFPAAAAASVESAMEFNNNNSIAETLTTTDALGRPAYVQHETGPGSSRYDTVETLYDAMGRAYKVSAPYDAPAANGGSPQPGSVFTTKTYDELSRPLSVTDGGGGSVGYSYPLNDVLLTRGPAATNSPLVQKQEQFDALGRLTSVCETNTFSDASACGQAAPQNGYLTSYTRNALGEIAGVTQGAETRSFSFDKLGRVTQAVNPENGTTRYYYGPPPAASGCTAQLGALAERQDAAGNVTCYAHDALERVTAISYPTVVAPFVATPAKTFVYDTATLDGQAMTNAVGRLAEAYTGPASGKITDLGWSYNPLGQTTGLYQASPDSGGYYLISATVAPDGALTALSLPAVPAIGYTLDGEGRMETAAVGATGVMSEARYNPVGQLTQLTWGSGDIDNYAYSAATGALTRYQFNLDGAADTGTLGWNADGTLASTDIADGIPGTDDTQNCAYAHDVLGRLTGANCGSAWQQTFEYDRYGNVAASGTQSFGALYNTDNQISSNINFVPVYNFDGDLLDDPVTGAKNTNEFDAGGSAVMLEGITAVYDALGRPLESSRIGNLIYGPLGRLAEASSGSASGAAYMYLPGGEEADFQWGSSEQYYNASIMYLHMDGQASARLLTRPQRSLVTAMAFSPFGRTYDVVGPEYFAYAGMSQPLAAGLDNEEALWRGMNVIQGRWWTPDPAGLAAVNPANPQSWNQYAYVSNQPLSHTDPTGLVDPAQLYGWLRSETGSLLGAYGAGGCTVDGADAGCGFVDNILASGDGAVCPNNNCTLVGSVFASPDNGHAYTLDYQQGEWGYVGPDGEDWVPGVEAAMELGLPGLDNGPDLSQFPDAPFMPFPAGPTLTLRGSRSPAGRRRFWSSVGPAACSEYGAGSPLQRICSGFGSGAWRNSARGCLLQLYSPGSGYLPDLGLPANDPLLGLVASHAFCLSAAVVDR